MALDPLMNTIQTPQYFYDVQSSDRFHAICRLIDTHVNQRIIVFCRTKKDVDHMSEKLELLGYQVSSYHGDLSPTVREKALDLFHQHDNQVLILTDLPQQFELRLPIGLVLFCMVPQDPDSYIQRIIRLESTMDVSEVATLVSQNEFKKIAFIKRVTKTDIHLKAFLPPAKLIDLKKERLSESIRSFDHTSYSEDLHSYSKALLNVAEPDEVVAFLLSTAFNGTFSEASYKSLTRSTKKNEGNDAHNDASISDTNERLFIAIGKADGINEDVLLGFLNTETNIDKQQFSDIKIFDTFSFFVVSKDEAEVILEIFRRKKRGKRSIVERAKGKDSLKKKA
jgi:ATP-dependent RNA helicase DeaD